METLLVKSFPQLSDFDRGWRKTFAKETVYDWYLEQELEAAGISNKKSLQLIKKVLKMTPKEKESLLKVLKEEKIVPRRPRR